MADTSVILTGVDTVVLAGEGREACVEDFGRPIEAAAEVDGVLDTVTGCGLVAALVAARV